jgi:hypothetical protein
MTAKSFKQMRNDGELVRGNAEKIDYFSLHVEPGYNPSGRTEEEEANDEELFKFICQKGVLELDDLRVRPREEGGVYIVRGHRRHKQIGRAIREGIFKPDEQGRYLVRIRQFVGNDLDRLYDVVLSNKRKDIKPLQFAELVQRAHHGFGQSIDQIADGMQVSVSVVRNALMLISANHDVKQAVNRDEISATAAIDVVRDHGEDAGKVIEKAKEAAKSKGRSRVAAKDLPKKGPSKRELAIATAVRDMCRDAFDIKALSVHEWRAAIDALDLAQVIGEVK